VFYDDAMAVKAVTAHHGIPLIINDRVDIAMLVDADGVHLGQDDIPFAQARRLIGDRKILGASVHNLDELTAALPGNPDYLGVGTIYPSASKATLADQGTAILKAVRQMTGLPIVGIGGITLDNLKPVIAAGANGVAVISALSDRGDIKQNAQALLRQVEMARRD
jgi:thiamine-phosphate pyrophosphorylase